MKEIKCTLLDLAFNLDGTQRVVLSTTDDCRSMYDELKDKPLSCKIKQFRKQRSLNANDYLWVLCTKLAVKLNITKEEIYRMYIKAVGKCDFVAVPERAVDDLLNGWSSRGIGWFAELVDYCKIEGCRKICLYYGSSTYNTKEMSRLIDCIVQDCKAQGIETITPNQLAELKAGWGE